MSKYLTQLCLFLNHPHKIVNGYIGRFELLVVVLLKKMSFSHIRHTFVTYLSHIHRLNIYVIRKSFVVVTLNKELTEHTHTHRLVHTEIHIRTHWVLVRRVVWTGKGWGRHAQQDVDLGHFTLHTHWFKHTARASLPTYPVAVGGRNWPDTHAES